NSRGMRPLLVLAAVLVVDVVAPPPRREAPPPPPPDRPVDAQHNYPAGEQPQQQQQEDQGRKLAYEFTYSKYLEEVVKILETDPVFNEKLRQMPEADIKEGKIADHLDAVPDPIAQRLHTLKVAELERLREQLAKQIEVDGGAHNIKMPQHLDLQNWEKFGKEDLRLLIKQTVADMEEIDRQRAAQFKEYEMKKKAEEDHKLAQMAPQEREQAKHDIEEKEKRHNEHEKLKHPGSRDQLEEVWEESDNMDKDSFDPRTFFNLHDLNGDGFWNTDELEALFQIELDKMYNETNPDDDPREKYEEMNRMREHVVRQMDKNNDRMISLEEFMKDSEAQAAQGNKDQGWEDIGQQLDHNQGDGQQVDHNQVYTDEELRKFEAEYAQQMGWGADAYQPVDAPPPPAGQQAQAHEGQQQQHQPPPVPVQPIQHQQPPTPPVQQQQQQQVHAAVPPQQAQQQQQQQAQPVPVQPHQPIHDIPKDPAYGI
ncbi:nucb-1, partial [Pristionchus pacificus]